MKTQKIKAIMLTALLLLTIFILNFNSPETKTIQNPPSPGGNEFIVSSFDNGYDVDYQWLDEAGFTLWHLYGEGQEGPQWFMAARRMEALAARTRRFALCPA